MSLTWNDSDYANSNKSLCPRRYSHSRLSSANRVAFQGFFVMLRLSLLLCVAALLSASSPRRRPFRSIKAPAGKIFLARLQRNRTVIISCTASPPIQRLRIVVLLYSRMHSFGLNPISEQLCLVWILPKTASAADCVHIILRRMHVLYTPSCRNRE